MSGFRIPISKFRGLTEEEALDSDNDIIPKLSLIQNLVNFEHELDLRRSQIEKLIHRHLGIPQSDFELSQSEDWICGSFNICLPIYISRTPYSKLPQQALIRFPLPFAVGETFNPGNTDEKLRCEAATYIWLQSNCPAVPIPRLLGMGFPGTQSFTAIENESLWNWIAWQVRRSLAWLYGGALPPYFAHPRDSLTDLGYLLMEYVVEGNMLSSSWQQHRHNEHRRGNLYRSLAQIMLSLASVPLPRIGSWTMDDRGIISLTNRPLSDLTLLYDRHQIPTDIPRNMTYSSAQPFVHDMLACQDNRMRHQPNSILGKKDGIYQLSALTALRSLLPRFWDKRSRCGPFVLTLPDLHQSNMFVDDEWNITRVIDLEFAPVRPVQMAHVPSWLSSRGIDELDGPDLDEYKVLYDDFIAILEREETAGQHAYSQVLRESWSTGGFWYSIALDSINAFPSIFEQHLQPKFFEKFELDTDGMALAQLWDEKVLEFITRKLEGNQRYEEHVRKIFAEARACESEEERATRLKGQEELTAGETAEGEMAVKGQGETSEGQGETVVESQEETAVEGQGKTVAGRGETVVESQEEMAVKGQGETMKGEGETVGAWRERSHAQGEKTLCA